MQQGGPHLLKTSYVNGPHSGRSQGQHFVEKERDGGSEGRGRERCEGGLFGLFGSHWRASRPLATMGAGGRERGQRR